MKNRLCQNTELCRGDLLVSTNQEWAAIFQDDGNFVVYNCVRLTTRWNTGTSGSDASCLRMEYNGNLVMYNPDKTPRWQTNTGNPCCNTCSLLLTDHGFLLLYLDREIVWTSIC